MENWDKVELYILLITISVGAGVSVLDFTGLLNDINWLKERIPILTLLLVTLIATSLLIGTHSTRQFIKSILPSGAFRHFKNEEETTNYILERMKKAKYKIDDMTLQHSSGHNPYFNEIQYKQYIDLIEKLSKTIKYREIIFYRKGSQKWRRLTSSAGSNYQLVGYSPQPNDSPVIWNFIIIDDEIILINEKLAVKQSDIVKYFEKYYNTLWTSAKIIKVGMTNQSQLIQ